MADPAAQVPPVPHVMGPVLAGPAAVAAPPIPFANVPGTITQWIMTNFAVEQQEQLVQAELHAAYTTNYSGVVNMDVAEQTARYHEISANLLASPVFRAFFIVMDEGNVAMLHLVHTVKRYSCGIGATAQFSGTVFGFLGDVNDGQLPQLVAMSDRISLPFVAMLRPFSLPSAAAITTSLADPNRIGLVPGPAVNPAVPVVHLPILAYCPTLWAPYFMAPMTVIQGFELITQLIDNSPAAIAASATTLHDWFRLAVTRAGPAPANHRSCVPPVFQPKVVNAPVRLWSASVVAPFISPISRPAPPVPLPGVALGLPGPPPVKELATKAVLSGAELEYLYRVAGCMEDDGSVDSSQTAGGYDLRNLDQVPTIWGSLLTEGRTKSRFSRLLAIAVAPGPALNYLAPVTIHVTADMVADFLELKFGYYDGDTSYANCHRGYSPFTVPQLTMEQTHKRRRFDIQLEKVTTITIKDAIAAESIPSASPANYASLTKQLEAYVRLGLGLVGPKCEHIIQVNKIRMVLASQFDQWSDMSPTECANLLWAIFLDSRQFFRAGYEFNSVPRSNLALLIRQMEAGHKIEGSRGTPLARLLGHAPIHTPRDTLDDVSVDRKQGPASAGNHTMVVPPAIAAEMAKIVAASPSASPFMLLQHEKAADLHLGPPRSCMALRLFGACDSASCTYSHAKSPAQAANLSRVLATLKNVTKSIRLAKDTTSVKPETPSS